MIQTKKITCYLVAFLAYNLYSVFLISAFFESTGGIFDRTQIDSLVKAGEEFNPKDWGWNGHYLWMLFSSTITTVVSSLIGGAISKDKKGITTLVCSIPTIITWGFVAYVLQFSDSVYVNSTETTIVALINIPLTAFLAYNSGKLGANIQHDVFSENTFFGVAKWNLTWLAFPLYWFLLGAIGVGAKLVITAFQSLGVGDFEFLERLLFGISFFLLLISTLTWCAPLLIVYKILSRQMLSEYSIWVRGVSNITVLVAGWPFAYGVEIGCFWIIRAIAPFFL